MTSDAVAIVLAAGSGERLAGGEPGRRPKAFLDLAGRPMLVHAARAALACPGVGWIVVAAPAGFEDLTHAMLEPVGAHAVVTGGTTRQASVRAALRAVPDEVPFVVCHDAARPFASSELFLRVLGIFESFPEVDGAVPVLPVPDTVKRTDGGFVVGTEPRERLVLAQTPQAFRARVLREVHEAAAKAGRLFTDDAAVLEWAGRKVRAVSGEPANFKITTSDDLMLARRLAAETVHG